MDIDIRYLGFEASEELKVYTEYRFKIGLRSISNHIDRVTIRIVGLSGEDAVEDKMCRACIRFNSAQTLFLEEKNASLINLIDGASNKIAESAAIMDSQWRKKNHPEARKKIPGRA